MPLPKPRGSETKEEFIARFMGDPMAIREYPDPKQRRAVAEAFWDHPPEDQ